MLDMAERNKKERKDGKKRKEKMIIQLRMASQNTLKTFLVQD